MIGFLTAFNRVNDALGRAWSILGRFFAFLKGHLARHFAFWVTCPTALGIFLFVPQIRHVWWPNLTESDDDGWLHTFLLGYDWSVLVYVLWIAILLWFYIRCAFFVVLDTERISRVGRPRLSWRLLLPSAWAEFSSRIVLAPAGLLDPKIARREAPSPQGWRFALGIFVVVVLAVTALTTVLAGADADSSNNYPLAGAFCRHVGVLAAFLAWWLGRQLWTHRTTRDTPPSTALDTHCESQNNAWRIARLQGRLLDWMVVTAILGELIWVTAATQQNPVASPTWLDTVRTLPSFRLYTVWAVLHGLIFLVILGQLLDRWNELARWPVRIFGLGLFPILALWLNAPSAYSPDDHFVKRAVDTLSDWANPPSAVQDDDYLKHLRPDDRKQELQRREKGHRPHNSEELDNLDQQWFDQFARRIKAIPAKDGGPVVIVSCSGGGSRAAIFTTLALETLARTPLHLHPNQSSAMFSGDHRDGTVRTWGDNIVLISSVSGGSLASAHYVRRLGPVSAADTGELTDFTAVYRPVHDLKYTDSKALKLRLTGICEQNLAQAFDPSTKAGDWILKNRSDLFQGHWSEGWWTTAVKAEHLHQLRSDVFNKLAKELRGSPHPQPELYRNLDCLWLDLFARSLDEPELYKGLPGEDLQKEAEQRLPEYAWVLKSSGFDEMCTDFMAPMLRGGIALTPALDRGNALALFWTNQFDWWNCTNARGYYDPDPQKTGYREQHPLLVLNACDAVRGSQLAVGFPTLPRNLWNDGGADSPSYEKAQTFSKKFPGCELSLSRGVRMSSNFPWGLRVMSFPAPRDANRSERQPLHVLDGGVVDNSGLDTLYDIFDALSVHAEKRRDPKSSARLPDQKYHDSAAEVWHLLRDRKVVIVEIDASAKPAQSVPWGLTPYLLEPATSLDSASYMNTSRNRDGYLDGLIQFLPPGTGYLLIQCNHYLRGDGNPSQDVMTAWALGTDDKAAVVYRSLLGITFWKRSLPDLSKVLEEMKSTPNLTKPVDPSSPEDIHNLLHASDEVLKLTVIGNQTTEDLKNLRASINDSQGKMKAPDRVEKGDTDLLQKQLSDYQKKTTALNAKLLKERVDENAKLSRDAFDKIKSPKK